jgi:hypothetical protein
MTEHETGALPALPGEGTGMSTPGELFEQLAVAVKALEQARDLLAQAYRAEEPDDSPGNMAFAVLNAALAALGGPVWAF